SKPGPKTIIDLAIANSKCRANRKDQLLYIVEVIERIQTYCFGYQQLHDITSLTREEKLEELT
ncbi:hypothetical protein HK096_011015, partial [Nowakowskiella sp. JEL0078]